MKHKHKPRTIDRAGKQAQRTLGLEMLRIGHEALRRKLPKDNRGNHDALETLLTATYAKLQRYA
jgi:hypothetical protein